MCGIQPQQHNQKGSLIFDHRLLLFAGSPDTLLLVTALPFFFKKKNFQCCSIPERASHPRRWNGNRIHSRPTNSNGCYWGPPKLGDSALNGVLCGALSFGTLTTRRRPRLISLAEEHRAMVGEKDMLLSIAAGEINGKAKQMGNWGGGEGGALSRSKSPNPKLQGGW